MHTHTRMVIDRLIEAHEAATGGGDEHSERARGFFDMKPGGGPKQAWAVGNNLRIETQNSQVSENYVYMSDLDECPKCGFEFGVEPEPEDEEIEV